MKNTKLIQLLAELALKHYHEGIAPDLYAAVAAEAISTEAAATLSPESAKAAAFVAVSTMIDLSKIAARQGAFSIETSHATQKYYIREGVRVDRNTLVRACNDLATYLNELSFSGEASQVYDTAFASQEPDNQHRLALKMAAATYMHGFSCTRSAYMHAVALAAISPEGNARDTVFKRAITQRLSSDLLSEPIKSSFMMSILCSDAMIVAGSLLLIAGLSALSAGIAGIAVASVGALLASSIGVTSTTMMMSGGLSATVGAGCFVGRFFAFKQLKNDHLKRVQAVHAMNGVEYDAAKQSFAIAGC
jgi:hypothetical protein